MGAVVAEFWGQARIPSVPPVSIGFEVLGIDDVDVGEGMGTGEWKAGVERMEGELWRVGRLEKHTC